MVPSICSGHPIYMWLQLKHSVQQPVEYNWNEATNTVIDVFPVAWEPPWTMDRTIA